MNKVFWHELVTIMGVFLAIDLLLFFGLKTHYKRSYSPEKAEAMIEGISRWKEITDDPCKWSILGDPLATENSFIKLNLYCAEGKNVANTMDLTAVSGKTYEDLLKEYVRLQGIDKLTINDQGRLNTLGKLESGKELKWACFINGDPDQDLRKSFKARDEINCFYANDQKIAQVRKEYSKSK